MNFFIRIICSQERKHITCTRVLILIMSSLWSMTNNILHTSDSLSSFLDVCIVYKFFWFLLLIRTEYILRFLKSLNENSLLAVNVDVPLKKLSKFITFSVFTL